MLDMIRMATSERGPLLAIILWAIAQKLKPKTCLFSAVPATPPHPYFCSRQQIRLSALPLPCPYGQRLHPSQHAIEQPPRQLALGQ
jgi:hypothetical protein